MVCGKQSTGSIITLVERKSRLLLSAKLPVRKASLVADKLTSLLGTLPKTWRRTLALDNGKEFAAFKTLEQRTSIRVFFADPYAAYQRGSNENTNGLLRQYIPKGFDMAKLTPQKLAKAVRSLNHRPRKCLGYKTPFEVSSQSLNGAVGS